MKRSIAIVVAIVAALWTESAGAQTAYPSKLVRLLCWTSAGSPLDVMMRQIGKQFGEMFGQTFVVENRPGGEGVLAMSLLRIRRRTATRSCRRPPACRSRWPRATT